MYGIKNCSFFHYGFHWFENDVNMYGIQTIHNHSILNGKFENDVNMYGIQTFMAKLTSGVQFENDVNMYGIQTFIPGVSN